MSKVVKTRNKNQYQRKSIRKYAGRTITLENQNYKTSKKDEVPL
jgi:hypothetical protein